MNTISEIPYTTPAFDGNNPAVFVFLPQYWPNGPNMQSVGMSILEAEAFAAQLIRNIEAARKMAEQGQITRAESK